jgi:hypothetical protein
VKLALRRLHEAGYVKASIMTAWQSEMVTAREIRLFSLIRGCLEGLM